METFTRKGYGRIFVSSGQDVAKVHHLIKELDPYEHGYMPVNIVAPISEFPKLVYLHKFCDMDLKMLSIECMKRGFPILIIDNDKNEFYSYDPPKIEEFMKFTFQKLSFYLAFIVGLLSVFIAVWMGVDKEENAWFVISIFLFLIGIACLLKIPPKDGGW